MDIGGFFINIKNWLVDFLNQIQALIIALLPDSPFSFELPDNVKEILGYINWVVPFYMIVPTLLAWCGCIAIYYAYQTILRWTKTVE